MIKKKQIAKKNDKRQQKSLVKLCIYSFF